IAVFLALATGAAVAQTVDLAAAPVIVPSGGAAPAAVPAFYDAANSVIETGDASALDTIVAPDFVDHAPAPGAPPTRDGLARPLLGPRAAFPGLRLAPDDVAATGDRVVARVRLEGAAAGRFLGLPLGGGFAPWGPIDVFRVAGNRVVERWGTAA